MAEPDTRSPRLAIDGPREPRTKPFRHRHSPRARRRAEELGAVLDVIDGSGPDGRVLEADVERMADEAGSAAGASRPRLAVDGPIREHTGPYRHTHSPRVRRRAELGTDPEQVDGTCPNGRIRPTGVEEAASRPGSAARTPSEDAPPTSSTRSVRGSSAQDAEAEARLTRTVQLDLGPTVAACRRLTTGPRPEGVEATPFLLVVHALLAELPRLAAAVGSDEAAAAPIEVVLAARSLRGPRPIVDGQYLTIVGLLRCLEVVSDSDTGAAAPLAVIGQRDSSDGRFMNDDPLIDFRVGPVEDRPAASQDQFGHQVTTIRPTAELTMRYDPNRVPGAAVDDLFIRLTGRLAHIHRTIGF